MLLSKTPFLMKEKTALLAALSQFTGTTQWYYHPMFENFRYTDGVRFVAQEMGAYWLLQHIFLHQTLPELTSMDFQVWKLQVQEDNSATIRVEDGNDHLVKAFPIPFTDFPLDEITFWMEGIVLLLPSEH